MENEILQQILIAVNGLSTDVAGVKADIAGVKADVTELKTDVETLKIGQQVITRRIDKMDETLMEIKENVVITRHSTNLLLSWSEKAENVVKVGLYE